MKFVSISALAAALAFGAAATVVSSPAAAAKEEAAPSYKLSKQVREPVAAAQTALKGGDTATALTQLATAKAAAKSQDEQFVVGSVMFDVARQTKDQQQQAEALDLMLNSGKVAPAQVGTFYLVRGQLAYNSKDFAKADEALQKAIQANATDPNVYALLAETRVQQKQPQQAIDALMQGIAKMKASGQTIPNEWFGRGVNIAYSSKLPDAADQITMEWLNAYPTASNWRDSLIIYRDLHKPDAETQLDLWRLTRTAKALKGQADYVEYADTVSLKYPGEAKGVLDEGAAAGYIKLDQTGPAKDINGVVSPKISADKASLAKAATTAKGASGTYKQALTTADAYLGYGMWNEAIELYQVALTKSGADQNLVNTRLGMAQARAGQKDAAKASFAKVTGPRTALAKYWMIYLDKGSTPSAA